MVAYVNTVVGPELGINALYRVGGDRELLMRLVANDFPVIIERGIILPEDGWMGHYSLIVGYDSVSEEYLLFDSYYGYSRGEGRRYEKEFIEEGWRQFNYVFIVLYEPHQADLLSDLLGEHADPAMAAQIALDRARDQVRRNPDDKWAWFNVGTSYTLLENYQDAALAYDRAFTMNQEFRMLWYQFGPYVAYYNTGRYSDVLALALATEKTTEYVEETYYYRGLVYAAQGNTDSAIFQFDRAISHNENFTPAIEAKQSVLEGRFSAPSG
jgi:tetratricopeptide (TPR) repeat protein